MWLKIGCRHIFYVAWHQFRTIGKYHVFHVFLLLGPIIDLYLVFLCILVYSQVIMCKTLLIIFSFLVISFGSRLSADVDSLSTKYFYTM